MAEGSGEVVIAPPLGSRTPESSPAGNLNVFISYSRKDCLEFADQLFAALTACGHRPTIDRHGIYGAQDWEQRLGELIAHADTVVFVLSPESAVSGACKWEVDKALALSKRIIPVLAHPLGGVVVPDPLPKLNYIFFYPEPSYPGSGWGGGLMRLAVALNSDLDWLREHTRLLERAEEWNSRGRPGHRLLTGDDIAEAKAWAARQPTTAPDPTPLQLAFIAASEQADAVRADAAKKQIEEREQLLLTAEADRKAREKALADAEAAHTARARTRRYLVWGSTGAAVAMAVVMTLSVVAFFNARQSRAEMEKSRAELENWLTSTKEMRTVNLSRPCAESIEATKLLATTRDPIVWERASKEFWGLYRGPMITLENFERKRRGGESRIANMMIRFGQYLPREAPAADGLPLGEMVEHAESVKRACDDFLNNDEFLRN